MSQRLNIIISWLLCLIWMAFIFLFSSFTGETSGKQSGFFVGILQNFLSFFHVNIDRELLSLLVRKAAHMFEYFVLYLLFLNATGRSLLPRPKLISLFLCFLYACTDEYHQSFTPDRGPALLDVLVDTTGSLAALVLTFFLKKNIDDIHS